MFPLYTSFTAFEMNTQVLYTIAYLLNPVDIDSKLNIYIRCFQTPRERLVLVQLTLCVQKVYYIFQMVRDTTYSGG